ncbi:NAD(P)/FAD-dependent oxidoreductase [Streptomyces sp. NPDC048297]|uniref:NAD(P)/FAD-dependent oxidoreductase n=1 Tax=Streptomyces sp. NPDC048297 TaxID=3365531 RepID=UPI0037123040
MNRVVVVGASLAGVSAAESLRERGFDGDIVLVGAEDRLPYTRPPLSKAALADGVDESALRLREPAWFEEQGVTLRLGEAATALDTRDRVLRLGAGTSIGYDGLVIATGSISRRMPMTLSMPAVHTLRTHDDACRLREALVRGGHLVVVGAGFIGLETAATARGMGLEVTVVDVMPAPMHRFGEHVGAWFRDLHERNGVRIVCSTGVDSLRAHGDRAHVILDTGETLIADTVLVGVGGIPATAWLTGSAVRCADGVRCEPDLSTGVPGVVAAGDAARWHNALFAETMRVEHWTNAVEQGVHAAGTLLGEPRPFESVPYFWTDQFEAKLRCVGRISPEDTVAVLRRDASSLVAAYGRDGIVRGAVCINAPRQLATLRSAIADRTPFRDIAGHAPSATSPAAPRR